MGVVGGAFLVGIAAHSLAPYRPMVPMALPWLFAGVLLLLAVPVVRKNKWALIASLALLGFVGGVWRFDLARPILPFELKPLDPNGFAFILPKEYAPQDPRSWLVKQRASVSEHIARALPGDQGALLAGMLYGERTLSDGAKTQFRNAGLLHLIAVSGSNVTILVVIIVRILVGLGVSRRSSFIALSIAILAFVFFVGPQASVVRAALMGWLIELAPLLGRVAKTSRLLLVSAVVFSIVHPWVLFFDPGFALSFLATIGLLTFGLRFNEGMRTWPIPDTLREILTATLAATMLTLPYTAWAFGQVSLVGLLTNMLAIPLVPWVMGSGALVLLTPAGSWMHLPAKGFLELLLLIARIPDVLPFGLWNNLSTSYVFMFGCYALLFVIWRKLKRKKVLLEQEIHNKHLFLS